MNPLIIFVAGILVGMLVVCLMRDHHYEAMYRRQRERGDHWFDRYQELLKEHEADNWWRE